MNGNNNCGAPILIDFWVASPDPEHCPVNERWDQLSQAFASCTVNVDAETITLTLANGATLVFEKQAEKIAETFTPAT